MGFTWVVTPEAAWPPLVQAQIDAIERDIVAFAESLTEQITAHMKREAPWQDRTGQARASLYSAVLYEARRSVTILLSHGTLIEYSGVLELGFAGRFAIIAPSADHFWPIFLRGVQAIVRKHMGR